MTDRYFVAKMPTKHYNIVGKESELPYYGDEQRHKSEKEGFMAVYEKITFGA